ncbi:hypothetical protein IT418_00015 [bacterium]|nr:hypothetical protein [bacterium]
MELSQQKRRRDAVSVVTNTSNLLLSSDSPWAKVLKQVEQVRSNFQVLLAPGEKQFKDLPKRVRLMVVSFGTPLIFSILKLYVFPTSHSISLWSILAFGLGLLTYWGTYWGLKGQVRRESYVSVLLLPSLFVIVNTLFLSTVFVGEINRLYLWGLFGLSLIVYMIFLYTLSLAVNILNVSLFYTIPLSRLGETVAYIAGVIVLFLLSYTIFQRTLPYVVAMDTTALALLFGGAFIITTALVTALWNYFVPSSRGFWLFVTLSSVFLTISLSVASLFLPSAWVAGIAHGMVSYVFVGYVIHKEQNTLNNTVYWELFAISVLSFLLVILV